MSTMGNRRGLTACPSGEGLPPAQPIRSASNEIETIACSTPASLVVVVSHPSRSTAPRLPHASRRRWRRQVGPLLSWTAGTRDGDATKDVAYSKPFGT
jgi:hypothetical protein